MSNRGHGFNPESQRRRARTEQEKLEAQRLRLRHGEERSETIADIDKKLIDLCVEYSDIHKRSEK